LDVLGLPEPEGCLFPRQLRGLFIGKHSIQCKGGHHDPDGTPGEREKEPFVSPAPRHGLHTLDQPSARVRQQHRYHGQPVTPAHVARLDSQANEDPKEEPCIRENVERVRGRPSEPDAEEHEGQKDGVERSDAVVHDLAHRRSHGAALGQPRGLSSLRVRIRSRGFGRTFW
jgi:hypothetical protein